MVSLLEKAGLTVFQKRLSFTNDGFRLLKYFFVFIQSTTKVFGFLEDFSEFPVRFLKYTPSRKDPYINAIRKDSETYDA